MVGQLFVLNHWLEVPYTDSPVCLGLLVLYFLLGPPGLQITQQSVCASDCISGSNC